MGIVWERKGVATLTCEPGEPAELGYSPSFSTTARRAFTLPGRRFCGCFPGALNFGVPLTVGEGSGEPHEVAPLFNLTRERFGAGRSGQ